MRAAIKCAVMAIAVSLVPYHALAQEVVPAPEPAGTGNVEAGNQAHSAPAASVPADQAADRWRYRWFDGHWWYWTPQNRWMWYNDEGRWIAYQPAPAPPAVEQVERSGNTPVYASPYYPRYGYGPYYPGYGYWSGYYPGVAVGVWPYGNVDVNAGRRVAVGVAGPHGAVRVGRIYVGW
jgi:hypothetical protein